VAGSTGTWLKHFLLLPVFVLALAPMVMASLSYAEGAAGANHARQTAYASIGSTTWASGSVYFHPYSDGNGGPPVL
jgi:hypothetical protein